MNNISIRQMDSDSLQQIEWAKQQGFPGLMLETQNNNVSICRYYEKCGLVLGGFDLYAYKNLDNRSEIALYWYLNF